MKMASVSEQCVKSIRHPYVNVNVMHSNRMLTVKLMC